MYHRARLFQAGADRAAGKRVDLREALPAIAQTPQLGEKVVGGSAHKIAQSVRGGPMPGESQFAPGTVESFRVAIQKVSRPKRPNRVIG